MQSWGILWQRKYLQLDMPGLESICFNCLINWNCWPPDHQVYLWKSARQSCRNNCLKIYQFYGHLGLVFHNNPNRSHNLGSLVHFFLRCQEKIGWLEISQTKREVLFFVLLLSDNFPNKTDIVSCIFVHIVFGLAFTKILLEIIMHSISIQNISWAST